MTDFRMGFLLDPRKQEPGMQQKYEETKKLQKMTHDVITPSSEETEEIDCIFPTPGKHRIQPFWSDEHGLAHHSTKPQVEVKKFYKENIKQKELINNGLQDTLDLRMANQEREIYAL